MRRSAGRVVAVLAGALLALGFMAGAAQAYPPGNMEMGPAQCFETVWGIDWPTLCPGDR